MANHKILVVLSSVRDGRHGAKVGQAVMKYLAPLTELKPEILDPADFDAPLLKQPLHFMPDKSAAPSWMTDIQSKIADASGFVIVSAEYNCAIPPALTNLLDYFPPADFRHKPASIVTYSMGPFGGIRVSAALKPFLAELGMVVLPSGVTVPTIQNSGISDDGTVDNDRIGKNMEKMAKELHWYVSALEAQKSNSGGTPN